MSNNYHSGTPQRNLVYAWEGEVEALQSRVCKMEAALRSIRATAELDGHDALVALCDDAMRAERDLTKMEAGK